jgi:hypothetical protein
MLKNYSIVRSPPGCCCFWCSIVAEFITIYEYRVAGKRFNTSARRPVCRAHAERFAGKYGAEIPS